MFSDYEDDGPMWTGRGDRIARQEVAFSESFRDAPSVQVSLTMWDMDRGANSRAEIAAENVTAKGFTAVFKTWGDTKVARARLGWMAVGSLDGEDDWDVV